MKNVNSMIIPPTLSLPPEAEMFGEMGRLEREFVAKIIMAYKPKNLLEVGVAAGAGTVHMLNIIEDIPKSKLTSIDISTEYRWAHSVRSGFLTDVVDVDTDKTRFTSFYGKDFAEIADTFEGKFDFLMLDTMHRHPAESLNFLTILPYLTDDAVVVLHDIALYSQTGVNYIDCIACKLLYDVVTAEKIEPSNYDRYCHYPNIGAFQINTDTKKYISDVFSMLRFPWGFEMGRLGAIRKVLEKHYDERCLEFFDRACAVNLGYLFCGKSYDFSSINDIFCKIAEEANEYRNLLSGFDSIYFYGAGRLGKTVISLFEALGLPIPQVIWDRNFEKISIYGYEVTAPDFNLLRSNDLVIVTVNDYYTALEMVANIMSTGKCKNVLPMNILHTLRGI